MRRHSGSGSLASDPCPLTLFSARRTPGSLKPEANAARAAGVGGLVSLSIKLLV